MLATESWSRSGYDGRGDLAGDVAVDRRRSGRVVHRPGPLGRPTSASPTTTPLRSRKSADVLTPCHGDRTCGRAGARTVLTDILTGLQDRFRILTGDRARAVRRQQTSCASVDWSHALLTEIERVLFRRLAVFLGGFDIDAAQAVVTDEHLQRHQVFDDGGAACWHVAGCLREHKRPIALPAAGDGAPVRAGKARRVG